MNLGKLVIAVFALLPLFRALGQNTLVVVSPHPEEIRSEFAQGFNAWHTATYGSGVKIDWRDIGGANEAQRFVESEFRNKAGERGIGIDLFFGGGSEPFYALASKGLLVPYEPPAEILEGIPKTAMGVELYDTSKGWFGSCLASFGILQNRRVQTMAHLPSVTRWDQLADPRLLGWVGAGDPRNSGAMNNMYESILQAYGWERGWALLTQIAGNVRQFDRFASVTAKETALGQVASSFCIDYYGFTQIGATGGTNLELVLPTDFTTVSPDGVAILRGAPHPETSARFINFVLSEAGQKLWYLPVGQPGGPVRHSLDRLPIRPSLYSLAKGSTHINVQPFEIQQSFHFDAQLARKRREIIRSLFGSVIIDNHRELVRAWRSIASHGRPADQVQLLGKVPLTEAEASQLADGPWKDTAFQLELRQQWQKWGRAKYLSLPK